ncbi:MAG TPA: cytidine deaminase [Firmicutes bacterium]|nr:cytidine deaminase [Bacillota bacterium]
MNQKEQELVTAARAAREQAYAPYSNYRVGAALRTASGAIFTGCNIENAAYGATVCAEQVAVFKAVSAGERDFVALAVAASGEDVASPCGTCRQVLAEFVPDLILYLTGSSGAVETATLKELLPRAFGPAHLTEDST